jgi:hypothetical protein
MACTVVGNAASEVKVTEEKVTRAVAALVTHDR